MAYTWSKLQVCDVMVGRQTWWKWRFDGRMPAIPEVEIWKTRLLWMFLLSLFSSSLYLFTSLDLTPVQMASARVFVTSRDKSSGGGVSPYAGSAEWLPYNTNQLWYIRVRMFGTVSTAIPSYEAIHRHMPLQPARSHSLALQVHISNLTRSSPPTAFPNSLNDGIQVHFQTHSITASMFILTWPASTYLLTSMSMASQFVRSRPYSASRSSLDDSVVTPRIQRADSPSSTLNKTTNSMQRQLL